MSTLREAAQQALEALESAHPKPYNEDVRAHYEAITALKAALAQQEQDWKALYDAQVQLTDAAMRRAESAQRMLNAALEQEEPSVCARCGGLVYDPVVAQEEQEPVTWGVDWGRDGDQSCCTIIKRHADGVQEVVAVEYGPPRRKWVGLTGDETMHLMNETAGNSGWADEAHIQRLRRAIEAALKEKNQ